MGKLKIYKNEIQKVIYNEDFKKVPLKIFTPNERNNLMAICSKLKKKWTNEVIFTFDELKFLTNWTKKDENSFIETVKSTNEKLMSLKNEVRIGSKEIQFVFFPKFIIDRKKEILTVQVQQEFAYLLNDFTKFNELDLEIYTNLASNYSKDIFEELMNFRKSGIRNFFMEDFKTFLNIPSSYRMYDIDRRILKVVEKELKPYFEKFEIEKVKKGRTITNIIFKFKFNNISYYIDKRNEDIEEAEIVENITDEEELRDFFIGTFQKYDIDWNNTVKNKLNQEMKKTGLNNVKLYLTELWEKISNDPNVKNKPAMFIDYIKRGERKLTAEDIKEIETREKKEPETVNPMIKKLFKNEEKTEEYWDKATPNNIYQPNIFENIKSIPKIQENQKEEEKKKRKITQEEYDELLEKYMKELGHTDKKIAEFFFNKVNNYEIIKNDITTVVDEIENKYNSYNKEFREFWKLDYLKDEFEKIKEHYVLDYYLEMKKDEMNYLKEQYKEFEEWKKEQIKKEEEHRKAEKEILKMAMGRDYEDEDFEDKKVYTVDDIPKDKLLSKNGKELKGIARKMRINKLLKEINNK